MNACQGCGTITTKDKKMMQCPLCQAEGHADKGFFCTQACFGKYWLEHRNSEHKSGVVIAKKSKDDSTQGKPKREREEQTVKKKENKKIKKEKVEPAKMIPLFVDQSNWAVLPSAQSSIMHDMCILSPSVFSNTKASSSCASFDSLAPRTVVKIMDDPIDKSFLPGIKGTVVSAQAMWSATHAISILCYQIFTSSSSFVVEGKSPSSVVIVCGSAMSAFAMAWALRCSTVGEPMSNVALMPQPELILSTSHDDLKIAPEDKELKSRIRIVSTQVLSSKGKKKGSNLNSWMDGNVVMTLPDVIGGVDEHLENGEVNKRKSGNAINTDDQMDDDDVNNIINEASGPEDYQTMSSKAIFFVSSNSLTSLLSDGKTIKLTKQFTPTDGAVFPTSYTFSAIAEAAANGTEMRTIGMPLKSPDDANEEDDSTPSGEPLSLRRVLNSYQFAAFFGRHDDILATLLARGDLLATASHCMTLYQTRSKGLFEDVVANGLFCDRGAVDKYQPHMKIAYLLRTWCIILNENLPKDKSLEAMTNLCKCCVRAVRSMPLSIPTSGPPGTATGTKKTDTMLTLQATCCFLLPSFAPEALVDKVAESWGITELFLGYDSLTALNSHRKNAIHKIRTRYGPIIAQTNNISSAAAVSPAQQKMRQGASVATLEGEERELQFLIILYHLMCNHCSAFSATITVKDIEHCTQWNSALAFRYGSIAEFVAHTGLADGTFADQQANKKGGSVIAKMGDKQKGTDNKGAPVTPIVTAKMITMNTYLKPLAHQQSLRFIPCPISKRQEKQNAYLENAAKEEIMSAMPRMPVPMYIGDVGQLIGIWTRFNAKYDGVLGYKLSDFLQKHPEDFTVVGNIVTRVTQGKSEQIRVRFDNDISSDDEDDGSGGSKRITSQGGRVLHRKAKKREEKKERNKVRYNKNHKQFDSSAKVPGYVKHGPAKVKGRGRKANVRQWKREK